jgi:D-Tyr-tRNAtyr deacylase
MKTFCNRWVRRIIQPRSKVGLVSNSHLAMFCLLITSVERYADGEFGAMMQVSLCNDVRPLTLT